MKLVKLIIISIAGWLIFASTAYGKVSSQKDNELKSDYWLKMGAADVDNTIQKFNNLNTGRAKNVILFIGDGMNLSTVVAGRIYKGQKESTEATGEETVTSLDDMPHSGLLKTYSVDHQTPDSAATATAFLCGVKTKSGMLGVPAGASTKDCIATKNNKVDSVLDNAAALGKSTGIVTTTRVQHATPAGAYAKSVSRSWYSNVPASTKKHGCKDIASQLVEMGKKLNVVLGGGRAHMKPLGSYDEEYPGRDKRGDRRDGKDLIAEWKKNILGTSAKYVWNKEQFDSVNPETTDFLMGLFNPFEMQFALDRNRDVAGEPSLSEMTEKAIKILQKNDNGFLLLVESGMIDKAHHRGLAHYALEEFLELEKSVEIARNLTSDTDTLIIVTADHGHVFTIGGGTVRRGNPILGLAEGFDGPKKSPIDNEYFTSSGYANGPGGFSPNARPNLSQDIVARKKHRFQAAVPLPSETHSSEDVVAFASGPMSHMITGVHEQNYVAHMINFAGCMGQYKSATYIHCKNIDAGKVKSHRRPDHI